jgi:hypothetical protein
VFYKRNKFNRLNRSDQFCIQTIIARKNLNKMCSQQACIASLSASSVSTMLLFYQVATRLPLATCWQIVELQDDNKLLEQLVTSLLSSKTLYCIASCQQLSRWQLVNKLAWTSSTKLRTHPDDKLLGDDVVGLLKCSKNWEANHLDVCAPILFLTLHARN